MVLGYLGSIDLRLLAVVCDEILLGIAVGGAVRFETASSHTHTRSSPRHSNLPRTPIPRCVSCGVDVFMKLIFGDGGTVRSRYRYVTVAMPMITDPITPCQTLNLERS